MRIGRLLILVAGLLVAVNGTAGAQDGGKAGITIAYPASIGFIWHATDTVAIRPAFSFAHTDSDSTIATSDNQSTSFGIDLGVLFYVKKYDNVRTYLSPRFSYSRTSSTSTPSSSQTQLPDITITGTSAGAAGVFGAQYSPSARFSVFGEAGIAFTQRKTESDLTSLANLTSHTWGTTAGVGVIFYF